MTYWNRSVYLGNHDLEQQLRAEIVRRWPEAEYPFHIEVFAEEPTSVIGVRVWSREGIHIFEEAIPKFSSSGEDDATIAAVLYAVDLAVRQAASDRLAVNRAVP